MFLLCRISSYSSDYGRSEANTNTAKLTLLAQPQTDCFHSFLPTSLIVFADADKDEMNGVLKFPRSTGRINHLFVYLSIYRQLLIHFSQYTRESIRLWCNKFGSKFARSRQRHITFTTRPSMRQPGVCHRQAG